jgi:cytidylate kinase
MYFITFSKMMGTNAEKIAKQTATTLGYAFFGEHEIEKVAKEKGFLSEVQKFDEARLGFFDTFLRRKWKLYLDHLLSVMYETAKKGNTVFFGYGAQLMLKSFDCALHVLVTGSIEKRVQKVVEEHRVEKDLAKEILDRSDHHNREFIRLAYGVNWLDPKLYDMIVNTDKIGIDSAVKMVTEAAKSDGIAACGIDSVNRLDKLSLHWKVESILLEAGLSRNVFVAVEDADTVRLDGLVYSAEEKEEVKRIVGNVTKGKTVLDNLQIYQRVGE